MHKLSITYLLIATSFLATLFAMFFPNLYDFWLNRHFLVEWQYYIYIFQIFFSLFLHWWFLHFLTNTIFLYIFGNSLEMIIWKIKYIIFFLFIAIFNWILITYFEWNQDNTIWISGFCMAILSYYVLELKSRNNSEYKWWITAIIINILIWFIPWISLIWHLFWTIWWIIYYFLNKNFFTPKLVGKIVEETISRSKHKIAMEHLNKAKN
jgi:membrane associated rhomboid family serine protease